MQNNKLKTVSGVSWSFLDILSNYGVTFLVGIVLARILTPEEFGLVSMITVFIAVSTVIVDSGFSNALIRKENLKNIDYNTVFYFNILLGLVLYTLLFLIAPTISKFFNEPELVEITRVIGLVLVINAFAIVQRTILTKAVDFKTQTKISLLASLVSGIVAIVLAFLGYGVWSLVFMQIVRQLLNTVLLWFFGSWLPLLEFSVKSFQEMFSFSSKLLFSSILDTLYNNIYFFVIGKYYSAFDLGQYSRAKQFSSLVSLSITTVVQRVSYPVLCNININTEYAQLKAAYTRIIKSTMLVTFTLLLGLSAIAKPLILMLIGEKWLSSVVYLQILCFSAMLIPLHAINLNMLMVKGKSNLFLKLEIIKKIIGIVPVVIGVVYGIKIMLVSSIVFSLVAFFLNSYYSKRLIDYSSFNQIKDIFPGFIVAICVAFCMWLITFLNLNNIITLTLQCLIGITLSIGIYEILKLSEYNELKKIVHSFFKKQNL